EANLNSVLHCESRKNLENFRQFATHKIIAKPSVTPASSHLLLSGTKVCSSSDQERQFSRSSVSVQDHCTT
ncbi:unnamed protein product, partial [Larinioides sclopetarius]